MMQEWKQKVRQLKREISAIYFACKHPKVPWYTKILANSKPKNWIATTLIIFIWLLLGFLLFICMANLI